MCRLTLSSPNMSYWRWHPLLEMKYRKNWITATSSNKCSWFLASQDVVWMPWKWANGLNHIPRTCTYTHILVCTQWHQLLTYVGLSCFIMCSFIMGVPWWMYWSVARSYGRGSDQRETATVPRQRNSLCYKAGIIMMIKLVIIYYDYCIFLFY